MSGRSRRSPSSARRSPSSARRSPSSARRSPSSARRSPSRHSSKRVQSAGRHEGLHRVVRRLAVRANANPASYVVGHLESGDQAEAVEYRTDKNGQVRLRILAWTGGAGLSGWVDLTGSTGKANLKAASSTPRRRTPAPAAAETSFSEPSASSDCSLRTVALGDEWQREVQTKEIEAKWADEKVSAILDWVETVKRTAAAQIEESRAETRAALEQVAALTQALKAAEAKMRSRHDQRCEQMIAKSFRRWNEHLMAQAIDGWCAHHEQYQRVRRWMLHLLNSKTAKVLVTWQSWAVEERALRQR
eukprot:SAG11_NODE_2133_length_3774_cov_6.924898_1_plen_302_part_10